MKTFIVSLFAVAAVGLVRAQPIASNSTGLLGQRYAELSGSIFDPHGTSDPGYAGNVSVQTPVQAGLDAGFGYGYSRLKEDRLSGVFNWKTRDHVVHGSLTAYQTLGHVKPFFSGALGYRWSRSRLSFGGIPVTTERDNEAIWALAAGVEVPAGRVTLTPSVAYQDGFKSGSASGFDYGVEAHTWFTRTLGGFVDATYSDPTGGGPQAWIYSAGVRVRF